MRVLILANGDPPSAPLMRRLADESDLMIATDGSVHNAIGCGVRPDIVTGDFDSMEPEAAHAALPPEAFVPTPDQDFADLEKAIRVACEHGAAEIVISGAAGGRIDHTLANFSLLLQYHNEVPLCILDDHSSVMAVSGPRDRPMDWALTVDVGDTVSLISLSGTAHVTITGVRWPLDDFLLPIGTRGVSNVAVSDQVGGKVRDGAVLVCHLFSGLDQRPWRTVREGRNRHE